ncbi:methylamine utilization protein [Paraglaciecola aquimarina]|uniref:Methylamine utilization protein n=1 Tax=Paraglaciecola algarum TaxID=3050085 RepID=A0ABS9D6E9_9ALTE|nr:methylamine utilization protein [Paraglaciecola sp. G1-23]MCF2948537.1 methylamine utilization protein [Paraglaciecola sp. G1-23]
MIRLYVLCLLLSVSSLSQAINIKVLDPDGKAVPNVVVYLEVLDSKVNEPQSDTITRAKVGEALMDQVAVMDQIDTQFKPHILAIQKNTLVKFPNSDSVKHHVYSFSKAKTFELQLYKNLQADPLLFSKSGLVVLGCNIHDGMLGYIYVLDTQYFAKTNKLGDAKIELPLGKYQLKVWSPLVRDDVSTLTQVIEVTKKQQLHNINLQKALLPNLYEYEAVDEFSDYE